MNWYEPRFKRITMSHDVSGNPAELVGRDGLIYYRKEGGALVELGSGAGDSLWEQLTIGGNAGINPKSWRHVIAKDAWLRDMGASTDSDLTFWAVYGGGGGGHPHIIVE